jgi:hypothetical protein
MIVIREPYWKYKAFGVAAKELIDETIEVQCSYQRIDGQLAYPYTYVMKCEDVKKYPTEVHKKILLYIVPIVDFMVKK